MKKSTRGAKRKPAGRGRKPPTSNQEKPDSKAGKNPMWIFIVVAIALAGAAYVLIFSGGSPSAGQAQVAKPNATATGSQNSTGAMAASPPKITFNGLNGAQYSGNSDSSVVFVEYSDFQCPYCATAEETIRAVKAGYPNALFVFRNYPLAMHQNAQKAVEAAKCAGLQGKFPEMHDEMIAHPDSLSVGDLKGYAAGIGLNATEFGNCLDGGRMAGEVAAEKREGTSAGIRGTPGFLVFSKNDRSAALERKLYGISDRFLGLGVNSAVVEVDGAGAGIVFAGAVPYSDYKSVLDSFN